MRAEIERELREGYERLAACKTVTEARELYEKLPKTKEAAAGVARRIARGGGRDPGPPGA
jgi:hypothetical protein